MEQLQEIGRSGGQIVYMDMLNGGIVTRPEETLSAYDPSVTDRWRWGTADFLRDNLGFSTGGARDVSERIFGKPFIAPETDGLTGLLDSLGIAGVTGLSAVPEAVQAGENIGKGDYLGAAGSAGSALLDAAPLMSPLFKGAKALAPDVNGIMDFMADESGALRMPGGYSMRGSSYFDQPHGIPRKKDPALYTPFSKTKHTTPPVDYEVTGTVLPTLQQPTTVAPEALKGKTMYFATGDRTSNQRLIQNINGVDLPNGGAMTYGGPEYMDQLDRGVWASEPTAMRAKENAWKEGAASGEDMLVGYMPMGERSGDFSRHMAETYGSLMDAAMGANSRAALDDTFRARFPDMPGYPGTASPEFSSWLASLDGGRRAKIIKFFDSEEAQQFGVPDVGAARFAITNPDLVKSDALSVGYRFGVPDVEAGLMRSADHPSYGAFVPRAEGTGSMTLGFDLPWTIGARDTALPKAAAGGKFDPLPKDIKSYMGNPRLRQQIDDQWVDEASRYGELLRSQGKEAADRYARGLLDVFMASQ